jgi:hypothetical protein
VSAILLRVGRQGVLTACARWKPVFPFGKVPIRSGRC